MDAGDGPKVRIVSDREDMQPVSDHWPLWGLIGGLLVASFAGVGGWLTVASFDSDLSFLKYHFSYPWVFGIYILPIALYFIGRSFHQTVIKQQIAVNELKTGLANREDELSGLRKRINSLKDENERAKNRFLRTTAQMRLRLSRLFTVEGDHITSLSDLIDLDKLQELQNSIAAAYSLGSVIIDHGGEPVTEHSQTAEICRLIQKSSMGKKDCYWFQRNLGEKAAKHGKPVFKRCRQCGLLCGAVPMQINKEPIATWLLGQARMPEYGDFDFEETSSLTGISTMALQETWKQATETEQDVFEGALDFLWKMSEEFLSLNYAQIQSTKEIIRRKEHEREAEVAWRALDFAGNAMFIADTEGNIIGVNHRLADRLGFSRKDIIGKQVYELGMGGSADLLSTCLEADGKFKNIKLLTQKGDSVESRIRCERLAVEDKTFLCGIVEFVSVNALEDQSLTSMLYPESSDD